MLNNTPLFSMTGMSHGASSKNAKQGETMVDPVETDSNPGPSDAEMHLKPFEDLSNPQGYTFFEPF